MDDVIALRIAARHQKRLLEATRSVFAVDLPDWMFGAEGDKLVKSAVAAVEHAIKSKCGVALAAYPATHVTETEHILWGFDETHGSGGKTIHGRFLLSFNAILTDLTIEVSYVPWDPKAGRLDHSARESESHGNVEEKNVVHVATALADKLCTKVHSLMKANAEAALKGKGKKREADTGCNYRVAARYLEQKLADQDKAAPKKVDDLHKEVKDKNPGYTDEQAWATAWSIYCKHVDPGSDHCHKSTGQYLKEAAEVREGDKVEITKGKEKGLKGTVKHLKAGPHGNQLAVDIDHPVHRMMGPAIVDPGAVKKIGSDQASISRPTPSAEQQTANDGEHLYHSIRPGDQVTIVTPHGQQVKGRAVMKGPAGWVLNLGGPHGRPGIASPENIVKVKSMGGKSNAWGIG